MTVIGVAPRSFAGGPTMAVACALPALATVAGSLVPAWRASSADPTLALRCE